MGSRTRRCASIAVCMRAVVGGPLSAVCLRGCRAAFVLAGVTVGVAVAACGGQSASPKPLPPRQLLQTALRDASAQGSVHEAESVRLSGHREIFSDDVGVGVGRQAITLPDGDVAHVLVTGGAAYVAGGESVLGHYFGFPAAAVRAIGSRWVRIPASSRAYSTVAYDATLATALQSFALTGPLAQTPPSTWRGQSIVGIQGEISSAAAGASGPVAATVYLSRASKPLPVAAIYRFRNGATATFTLDEWGEHLSLSAPARMIAQSAAEQALSGSIPRSTTSAVTPSTHTADHAGDLIGYWLATGRVLEAHDSAIQAPGEIIQRIWRIYRSCARPSCPLELERQVAGPSAQTLGTPMTAPLTTVSGGWRTSFSEPHVYCRGATTDSGGTENSAWQLTQATPSTIRAVETTRTAGPNCETATTEIIWSARRVATQSSAPA
jgi:hypothetical protein